MPKLYSNTSSLVTGQLPDYIKGDYISYVSGNNTTNADYSKFIQFVEAYYKFLEKETNPTEVLQNAKVYADVETTLDTANVSLVESFFKNYGNDIPRNLITNNKSFVKFFKDIYKTKGSEEAAKLLFRVLYNTNVEFLYPGNFVLKTSDGRWVRQKTLLVTPVNNSNLYQLINTTVTGQDSKATAKVSDVLKILKTNRFFSSTAIVNSDVEFYELTLEDLEGNFKRETIVSSYSSNLKANTNYQLVGVDILDGGAGYTLDNSINYSGSILKISKIDERGSIKNVSVVDTGVYFVDPSITDSFTQSFLSIGLSTSNKLITGNVKITGRNGTFESNVYHKLKKQDTIILNYFGNTNSNLNNVSNSIVVSKILDDNRFSFYLDISANTNLKSNVLISKPASLNANLGIVKISDGYYINNKGRLSDSYYLQGSLVDAPDPSILYYQPFSYVIRSEQSTFKWRETVKSTIHPSGVEVFGDVLSIKDTSIVIKDTGKSEIQDYLGLTADYENQEITADGTYYTIPKTGYNIPINADTVILIFGYL